MADHACVTQRDKQNQLYLDKHCGTMDNISTIDHSGTSLGCACWESSDYTPERKHQRHDLMLGEAQLHTLGGSTNTGTSTIARPPATTKAPKYCDSLYWVLRKILEITIDTWRGASAHTISLWVCRSEQLL